MDAVLLDLFGTLIDGSARPRPGAPELIASLPERWAIVTSCSSSLASAFLRTAQLPQPPVLVTSESVKAQKPAPDGYRFACEQLGVDPARTLAVEDSRSGATAALAAGCTVLLVTWGAAIDPPGRAQAIETLAQIACRKSETGGAVIRLRPPA